MTNVERADRWRDAEIEDAESICEQLRHFAERLAANGDRDHSLLTSIAAAEITGWVDVFRRDRRTIAALAERLENVEKHLAATHARRVADSLRVDQSIDCRRCGGRVWAIEAGDGAGPDLLVGADGRGHECPGEGGAR